MRGRLWYRTTAWTSAPSAWVQETYSVFLRFTWVSIHSAASGNSASVLGSLSTVKLNAGGQITAVGSGISLIQYGLASRNRPSG